LVLLELIGVGVRLVVMRRVVSHASPLLLVLLELHLLLGGVHQDDIWVALSTTDLDLNLSLRVLFLRKLELLSLFSHVLCTTFAGPCHILARMCVVRAWLLVQ